jgi:ribosomal protein S18 acetylase RimI-like enzyme
MNVRRATPEDAHALALVHLNTWLSTYPGLVPDTYLDSLSFEAYLARWQKRLENSAALVLVAEVDRQVVGFAFGGPERSGNFPTLTSEVYALYVLAAHQGRGIGRALVRSMARVFAPNHGGLLIWVLKGNPAQKFYLALGGEDVGEKEVEMGDARLAEVAYGWQNLALLTEERAS